MSAVIERIRRRARTTPRRLVLPEGHDNRILQAAERLARDRLAEVVVLGDREAVRAAVRSTGAVLTGVSVVDAADPDEIARTAAALRAARGDRLDRPTLEACAKDPMFQAAARVRDGRADCFVGGAARPTADVLRAAMWLIGLAEGVKRVSSFFLMVVPPRAGGAERVMMFADCAVAPEPDPGQLAEIGCLTADHFARLTGEVPHTAFLSFSTRGSAEHPRVARVQEAVALARARRPDLHIDGELQADAALVPEIGKRKAPDSVVAGVANVLIFPDLDSGNIGYKLVQRLAGAEAYGPILMGLARQANDLSRGCSAADVVEVATIACALAGAPGMGAGA